jgi:hypothetical protein
VHRGIKCDNPESPFVNANPLSECPLRLLFLPEEAAVIFEVEELLLFKPNDAFRREENDSDDRFMALRFTPPLPEVIDERDGDADVNPDVNPDDNPDDNPNCKKEEEDENTAFRGGCFC